jgi:D-glycero-D-manno-heptose 1,7-bisphosphate phosphatase
MITEKVKAAWIDRDGVLNDLVDRGEGFMLGGKLFRWTAPFRPDELRIRAEAYAALDLMAKKGYLRILATNQPDVATGNITEEDFETMMAQFRALPLTELCVCLHHPKAKCACRKPEPGMLRTSAEKYNIDTARSYMIGDLESDILAGKAVGARTILVSSASNVVTAADHIVRNVMEAAQLLP